MRPEEIAGSNMYESIFFNELFTLSAFAGAEEYSRESAHLSLIQIPGSTENVGIIGLDLRRHADGSERFEVMTQVRTHPHVRNVNLDWSEPSKVVRLQIDQDRARALGVSSGALGHRPHARPCNIHTSPDQMEAGLEGGPATAPVAARTSAGLPYPLDQPGYRAG